MKCSIADVLPREKEAASFYEYLILALRSLIYLLMSIMAQTVVSFDRTVQQWADDYCRFFV